jgi:hypothetical protein
MRGTSRALLTAAVVGLAGGVAAEAAAQVCIGFPTARGQGAVAVTANFPTGGNDFGAEAGYHSNPGFAVFGGVNVHSPDEGDNVTSFGGGAAFSLPEVLPQLPTGLYTCPVVSVAVATGGGPDDANVTSVPVGVGFGTILPLGQTMTLSPYAIPQFRWKSSGGDSDTDWLISGGAVLVGFLGPRLYAGVTVNRVFIADADSVLGLKFGVTF